MSKHSPLKFILGAAVLAFAMTGVLQATPEQDEVKTHLPAGVVADNPGPGQTLATNAQMAEAVRAAIAHAHPAFTAAGLTAGGASLRGGAAHLIVEQAVKQTEFANYAAVVKAAYDNSPITGSADKPAIVSALTAGAICGAYAKAGVTFDDKKNAAKAIVRQMIASSLLVTAGNTAAGDFRVLLDGSSPKKAAYFQKLDMEDGVDDNKGLAKGSAAVATGAVAQVTGIANNGANLALEANKLVKAIVKSAVKAAPKQYLEIVMAAATAGARVFTITGGSGAYSGATIKAAVSKILTAKKLKKANAAIKFAATVAAGLGAGSKGIRDYAYNNCNTNPGPVTDITGF